MYCGSCLHDNTLVGALRRQSVDALLLPTYTPIRTDEEDVSANRVFFGGINVYLQQKYPFFRHLPKFLDGWLDWPWLIRWLARDAVGPGPEALGALAVSMLQGTHGHQAKEVDQLVHWPPAARGPHQHPDWRLHPPAEAAAGRPRRGDAAGR
jgi:hypothetical protein